MAIGRWMLALCTVAAATPSEAAMGTFWGEVTSLRVEGNEAFIEISPPQTGAQCPDSTRGWVDLRTDKGRAAYSAALTAFSLQKRTQMRVNDTDTKINSACAVYDIYIAR